MTSKKKIIFECPNCHYEYITTPSDLSNKKNCPCCSGKITVPHINDISIKYPQLFDGSYPIQWDFKKNQDINLYPFQFAKSSLQKVYWIYNGKSILRTIRTIVRKLEKEQV